MTVIRIITCLHEEVFLCLDFLVIGKEPSEHSDMRDTAIQKFNDKLFQCSHNGKEGLVYNCGSRDDS